MRYDLLFHRRAGTRGAGRGLARGRRTAQPSRRGVSERCIHRPVRRQALAPGRSAQPIRTLDGPEIDGQPVALDLVSRPEVFAGLLPRLADGYALQAVEWSYVAKRPRCAANDAAAEEFLELVLGSRGRWVPAPGMGDAFVPTRHRIEGCGLRADGELVALSAFPAKRL